jgi:plasmid stability protein
MLDTCEHAIHMPTMIQLRNVPDDLHHRLKARAAMEGMSLSDYLIAEVARVAERPTVREMRERLNARVPVEPRVSPARAVRAERDRR